MCNEITTLFLSACVCLVCLSFTVLVWYVFVLACICCSSCSQTLPINPESTIHFEGLETRLMSGWVWIQLVRVCVKKEKKPFIVEASVWECSSLQLGGWVALLLTFCYRFHYRTWVFLHIPLCSYKVIWHSLYKPGILNDLLLIRPTRL